MACGRGGGNNTRHPVLGALNRAKVICSSSELFSDEVFKLIGMFLRNGYFETFFDRVGTSFQQRQNAGTGQVKYKKDINFNLLLRIPYVGILSHEFKSKTRQSRIYAENPQFLLVCTA